jgi:hypothetical protein
VPQFRVRIARAPDAAARGLAMGVEIERTR